MERTLVSGMVKKVEEVSENLSLMTLAQICDDDWSEDVRIPLYMGFNVGRRYIGKAVDVITKITGKFEQEINGVDISNSVEIDYAEFEKINGAN